ncbi:hypothetical protein AVEN_183403-1, partial [Araneus ventricosus]
VQERSVEFKFVHQVRLFFFTTSGQCLVAEDKVSRLVSTSWNTRDFVANMVTRGIKRISSIGNPSARSLTSWQAFRVFEMFTYYEDF